MGGVFRDFTECGAVNFTFFEPEGGSGMAGWGQSFAWPDGVSELRNEPRIGLVVATGSNKSEEHGCLRRSRMDGTLAFRLPHGERSRDFMAHRDQTHSAGGLGSE